MVKKTKRDERDKAQYRNADKKYKDNKTEKKNVSEKRMCAKPD